MTKHILVTNDDGVLAPGLLALTGEMRKLGHVSILAPDRNWSGGGHVKTLDRALRVREVCLADGTDYDPDLLDNKFSKSPKLKGLPENRGRAYARPLFSGSYSSFCNLLKVALFRSD